MKISLEVREVHVLFAALAYAAAFRGELNEGLSAGPGRDMIRIGPEGRPMPPIEIEEIERLWERLRDPASWS